MSQCSACANLRPAGPHLTCTAFPAGIPEEVELNEFDHRQPISGDNGVRWTALAGEAFPEFAFLPEALGRGRP